MPPIYHIDFLRRDARFIMLPAKKDADIIYHYLLF